MGLQRGARSRSPTSRHHCNYGTTPRGIPGGHPWGIHCAQCYPVPLDAPLATEVEHLAVDKRHPHKPLGARHALVVVHPQCFPICSPLVGDAALVRLPAPQQRATLKPILEPATAHNAVHHRGHGKRCSWPFGLMLSRYTIRFCKRPLRASLLSLTVLGAPQDTKGELGAAFWHVLPKMSGFVHVDRPRGQSNGPRLATTT